MARSRPRRTKFETSYRDKSPTPSLTSTSSASSCFSPSRSLSNKIESIPNFCSSSAIRKSLSKKRTKHRRRLISSTSSSSLASLPSQANTCTDISYEPTTDFSSSSSSCYTSTRTASSVTAPAFSSDLESIGDSDDDFLSAILPSPTLSAAHSHEKTASSISSDTTLTCKRKHVSNSSIRSDGNTLSYEAPSLWSFGTPHSSPSLDRKRPRQIESQPASPSRACLIQTNSVTTSPPTDSSVLIEIRCESARIKLSNDELKAVWRERIQLQNFVSHWQQNQDKFNRMSLNDLCRVYDRTQHAAHRFQYMLRLDVDPEDLIVASQLLKRAHEVSSKVLDIVNQSSSSKPKDNESFVSANSTLFVPLSSSTVLESSSLRCADQSLLFPSLSVSAHKPTKTLARSPTKTTQSKRPTGSEQKREEKKMVKRRPRESSAVRENTRDQEKKRRGKGEEGKMNMDSGKHEPNQKTSTMSMSQVSNSSSSTIVYAISTDPTPSQPDERDGDPCLSDFPITTGTLTTALDRPPVGSNNDHVVDSASIKRVLKSSSSEQGDDSSAPQDLHSTGAAGSSNVPAQTPDPQSSGGSNKTVTPTKRRHSIESACDSFPLPDAVKIADHSTVCSRPAATSLTSMNNQIDSAEPVEKDADRSSITLMPSSVILPLIETSSHSISQNLILSSTNSLNEAANASERVDNLSQSRHYASFDELREWSGRPKFNGDPTKWVFWHMMFLEDVGNNPRLSKHERWLVLENAVDGHVKQLIRPFRYCVWSYKEALDTMRRVFGSRKRLIESQLIRLCELSTFDRKTNLHIFFGQLRNVMISAIILLKQAGLLDRTAGQQIVRIVFGLLSPDFQSSFPEGEQTTLESLQLKIDKITIELWEKHLDRVHRLPTQFAIDTFKDAGETNENESNHFEAISIDVPAKEAATEKSSRLFCILCTSRRHNWQYCTRYVSAKSKQGRLGQLRMCIKCLKPMHSHPCNVYLPKCSICYRRHQPKICLLAG